jgi:hypothetical protein
VWGWAFGAKYRKIILISDPIPRVSEYQSISLVFRNKMCPIKSIAKLLEIKLTMII